MKFSIYILLFGLTLCLGVKSQEDEEIENVKSETHESDVVKRSAEPHRHHHHGHGHGHFGHHHHHHHGHFGHYHHGHYPHYPHFYFKRSVDDQTDAESSSDNFDIAKRSPYSYRHGNTLPHHHSHHRTPYVVHGISKHDAETEVETKSTGSSNFSKTQLVLLSDQSQNNVNQETENVKLTSNTEHVISKRSSEHHNYGSHNYAHPHLVPHGVHVDIQLGHHPHHHHGTPHYGHGIGKRSAEPHSGALSHTHPHFVPHGDHFDIHIGQHHHHQPHFANPHHGHGIGKRSAAPHFTGAHHHHDQHYQDHHHDQHYQDHHIHDTRPHYATPQYGHGIGKRSAEPHFTGAHHHHDQHYQDHHHDQHYQDHHHHDTRPHYATPHYGHGIGKRNVELESKETLGSSQYELVSVVDLSEAELLGKTNNFDQDSQQEHGIEKRSAEPHYTGAIPNTYPHGYHHDHHYHHHETRPHYANPYHGHGIGKRSANANFPGEYHHHGYPHNHYHHDHYHHNNHHHDNHHHDNHHHDTRPHYASHPHHG